MAPPMNRDLPRPVASREGRCIEQRSKRRPVGGHEEGVQPCGAEEVAVLKKKQSRRNPVVCHGSRGSATSKESVNVTTDHQVRAETLYQKHGKALVAFAASIVGPADAEDVVASVAAKVLFSADLDRANNPQAYLYRAVQNGARSHLRSNGRRSRREQRTAFDRALAPGTDAGGPDLASALDALSPLNDPSSTSRTGKNSPVLKWRNGWACPKAAFANTWHEPRKR